MTRDSLGRVPNQPKTPRRSVRVADDLWSAAQARAEVGRPRKVTVVLTGDETVSEAIRKFLERYARG